ncbi:MAG: nascent polypeptide-associated complex protein [Candidatus Thorarchaeota archaeon]
MIPGLGRGMNPRKMQRMMKQMGINIQEIEDVEKIIIRTPDKDIVFDEDVSVTVMVAQGQKTYQITGNPVVKERGEEESEIIGKADSGKEKEIESEDSNEPLSIPQEDIDLVCQQTGVSEEEAKEALEECEGNPAEAILKLMEKMN